MIRYLLNQYVKFFRKNGDERSLRIRKNIFYSFIIKGASVFISFLMVPLMIHYLNPVQYGIWITIYSLVAWINTFDIGLSNSLRNKLARLIALHKQEDALKYISTTYLLLLLIAAGIFLSVFIFSIFINWNHFLNLGNAINYSITPVILITTGLFCFQFILQPVNSILTALQEPFWVALILFTGQLVTIIAIFLLQYFTQGSLLFIVFITVGSPLLVLFIVSVYLYYTRLKSFAPRFTFSDLHVSKELLSSGFAFFFIQMGALVLYETDNIIITKTLGPSAVTVFNICYKYFSIIIIISTIVMTPYWSAFTDAYAKKDFDWITQSVRKMKRFWLALSAGCLLLFFIAPFIYEFWIGQTIKVPVALSFCMFLNVILLNWVTIHSFILNGIGKLKLQSILLVFASAVNIPLSFYLVHKTGITGTVWANIIVLLFIIIFLMRQCKLVLQQKAAGIWNS